MPVATVLYEDKMLPGSAGSYPLHDLVMRLVEDEVNGQTWRLRAVVEKNTRKGIDNVIKDVERTALIAGPGQLFVLVDRDVIAEHLDLPARAIDDDVVAALKARSDAGDKVHPSFLLPNLEGVLRSIRTCDPTLLPANVEAALRKKLNDRDLVFNEAKKEARRALRDCVRKAQPGLDALARAIAGVIPPEDIV